MIDKINKIIWGLLIILIPMSYMTKREDKPNVAYLDEAELHCQITKESIKQYKNKTKVCDFYFY